MAGNDLNGMPSPVPVAAMHQGRSLQTSRMKYDLIIFDLDGTLVNSMYDVGDALNYVFRHYGLPELTYDQVPAMVGGGMRSLLRKALGPDADLDEALRLLFEHYDKHYLDHTRPYPFVRETLGKLPMQLAVLSNKPDKYTKAIIRELDLATHFAMVLGHVPEWYERKPDPGGIRYILKHLHVAPQRTLMVGDSTHDIHAARRAAISSCGVTYGYRSPEQLRETGAGCLIDRFDQLLEII